MHMDAIRDDPCRSRAPQHRPRKPRLPIANLAHRVEKMRCTARTRAERRLGHLMRAVAVAEAHHSPRRRQCRDLLQRRGLGRQRHHQRGHPPRGLAHAAQILARHRTDQGRIMRPLPPGIEVRSFQMQAEEPRHPRLCRLHPGVDHGHGRLRCIRDKRGKNPRRPKHPMRSADVAQGGEVRRPVHHHPAAAIYLQVHETGGQRALYPLHQHAPGDLSNPHDPPAVEDHGPRAHPRPVENPRGGNRPHHIVSVTLRRCGGTSGSKPRLRASPSTQA